MLLFWRIALTGINAWCRWCMLLLININLKTFYILEYAFGEGRGNQKAYAVYVFINVDNCERPLSGPHLNGARFYSSIRNVVLLNLV